MSNEKVLTHELAKRLLDKPNEACEYIVVREDGSIIVCKLTQKTAKGIKKLASTMLSMGGE